MAIPIIHSVMSEPEFKDKYLGWGTKVGHMNCHVQSFGVDAYNTDTLRGSVEAAVLAKADIVLHIDMRGSRKLRHNHTLL